MSTQYIPSIGMFYKNEGFFLGGWLTVKNLWGLLTGNGVGLGAKSSDSTKLY